ncbi:hypothetical protein [Allomesorhizobium camelthorni]|nr:hypothetical protein [Mesorhizobium camelthorni]
MDDGQEKEQGMLAAKIVLGVAVLNMILLISALAMNVLLVYFG